MTEPDVTAGGADEGAPTFPLHGARFARRPLARWLARWGIALGAALPLTFWSALVLLHPQGTPPPPPAIIALLVTTWLGPLAALGARLLDGKRVPAAEVEVGRDALVLREGDQVTRTLARAQIEQGIELRSEHETAVLTLKGGEEVVLALDGEGSASAFLDACRIGPGERRAVFRWRRTFESILGALAGFGLPLGLFVLAPSTPLLSLACPLFAGLPWLLGLVLGRTVAERSIEIGSEGLVARGRLRTVLARFADLKDVTHDASPAGGSLVLSFRGGRVERVLLDPDDPRIAEAIVARLAEARAHAARIEGAERLTALLAETTTFEGLRATASDLLNAAIGFRDGAVTADEVQALLHDPNATAKQRIAAALALAGSDGSGPARVRVAAENVASPKLRVALEAAASQELDEAMLDAAEAEETRARAR